MVRRRSTHKNAKGSQFNWQAIAKKGKSMFTTDTYEPAAAPFFAATSAATFFILRHIALATDWAFAVFKEARTRAL